MACLSTVSAWRLCRPAIRCCRRWPCWRWRAAGHQIVRFTARLAATLYRQRPDSRISGCQQPRLIGALASRRQRYRGLWGDTLGAPVASDTTDGLRLTFASGDIVHLRPSGNAPELRCYAEAGDMPRAQKLVADTLQRIAG